MIQWWEADIRDVRPAKRLEFSAKTKREAYALRGGVCQGLVEIKTTCGRPIQEYDHIMRCEIKPDNSLENCRPLCKVCHAIKTAMDAKAAKKGRHIRRETKKSQKPKAKIRSRNTLSKEAREAASQWKFLRETDR
jgi:5-methylcytosine-specific restriction endonuclease McrA